jgi:hypothetical protein
MSRRIALTAFAGLVLAALPCTPSSIFAEEPAATQAASAPEANASSETGAAATAPSNADPGAQAKSKVPARPTNVPRKGRSATNRNAGPQTRPSGAASQPSAA